jgi:uncharacterized ion transporter superfamily protein YfcC
MSKLLLTYDPLYTRIGLAAIAILLVAGYLAIYVHRVRKARLQSAPGNVARGAADAHLFEHSVLPGTSVLADLMRGILILLAFCVAGGLFLVVLPNGTFDRMAQSLRLRNAPQPAQERISLLFLGDETIGKEFHIRGVIRNISTQPIENLDATIRLYASDGTLLETAVVRMDTESIAPDAISRFHLAYSDFNGQFSRYSVDFKLRQGEAMPYKDLRGTPGRS